jgi:UDP-N-acetyl-D-glucosamine dehydrogenase
LIRCGSRRSASGFRARSLITPLPITTEHVERADLVLVLTDHDALDWSLLEQWPARILDTRNRVKAPEAERL